MPNAERHEEFPALDKEAFSRLIAGYGFTMHNASGSSSSSALAELHKKNASTRDYEVSKSTNIAHITHGSFYNCDHVFAKVIKDAA